VFRFRSVIIILFGLLAFAFGVLYLSVERMEVRDVLVVTGPAEVSPGESAALRVARVDRRGHPGGPVVVTGGRFSGGGIAEQALELSAEPGQPAVVRFSVPAAADGGARVTLALAATDDAPAREVAVPLAVAPEFSLEPLAPPASPASPASPAAPAAPAAVEVGGDALWVSLLPEGRALAYRFDATVFVRVTDGAGAPVLAEVALSTGSGPALVSRTGPLGLAALPLRVDRPLYELRALATAADGRVGDFEVDLLPVPRGRRLRLLPRAVAPGGSYRVEVASEEEEETLHCDLLTDGRIRDSFTLAARGGRAAAERRAPAAPGRHALQCAPYWRTPGAAFATAALVVTPPAGSSPADEVAALAALVPPQDAADARWLAEVRARSGAGAGTLDREARGRAADYLAARLTPDYAASAHLLGTLEGDTILLIAERERLRGFLLLALGVALTTLAGWGLLVVLGNLRETRRRTAEVLAEIEAAEAEGAAAAGAPRGAVSASWIDGYDLPTEAPPVSLGRSATKWQFVLVAALLAAQIAALLWLLGTVVR
jgi:hypothetical protein